MVYYSGKIEGNTYTYVETEALLKDGITSEKQYENAKMLKNLHNLFVSEMEYIHKGKNTEIIDERTLLRLDSGLSSGLVSDEEAGQFRTRPVRISGIDYVPPRDVYEIRFKLSEVLYRRHYDVPHKKPDRSGRSAYNEGLYLCGRPAGSRRPYRAS